MKNADPTTDEFTLNVKARDICTPHPSSTLTSIERPFHIGESTDPISDVGHRGPDKFPICLKGCGVRRLSPSPSLPSG